MPNTRAIRPTAVSSDRERTNPECGDRRHRFAKLLFGGDLGGDVRGVHSARHGPCSPPDEHEQYRTHRDPGSRAGELGQLVHPTTTVDGMVMTQEATIFTTTRRLTPWPEATPEPVIEDAAAWVVEMGCPCRWHRRSRSPRRCWPPMRNWHATS
jgi:hypothetical protein